MDEFGKPNLNELRLVSDCPNVDKCHRRDIGFCGCDGKLEPVMNNAEGGKAYNCDRYACDKLESNKFERYLVGLDTTEDVKTDFEIKKIKAVNGEPDGIELEVIALTEMGAKRYNHYKTDVVVTESGVLLYPWRDKPGFYHPNRGVNASGLEAVRKIFKKLRE